MRIHPFIACLPTPASTSTSHSTSPTHKSVRSPRTASRVDPSLEEQRPRSLTRRRYRLPSLPTDASSDCCCCREENEDLMDSLRLSGAGIKRRNRQDGSSGSEDAPELSASRTDSGDSLESQSSGSSAAPSSSITRTRLFDSDDDDDDLLGSSFATDDTQSSFSPFTPPSWSSPPPPGLGRKTSLSRSPSLRKSSPAKLATSDPLLAPSPSPPTLSLSVGAWLPSPPETAATHCAFKSPELPNTLPLPVISSLVPPPSPPRRLSPPISLLTKSLRSLSRLPNFLPRLPTPDSYLSTSPPPSPTSPPTESLSSLAPGWGPAERRRILAAEPSHAADEARGFLTLRRHGKTPLIDELEAAADGAAHPSLDSDSVGEMALHHLSASGSRIPSPPPSPTSPSDDLPPLPPISSVAPPAASTSDGETPEPDAPPALAAPASPPPRFISNHRHLLMLSLEFEMMRASKIRGPLRQRAVIVRAATSPPRGNDGGRELETSGLRKEVCAL
ncbi:hypothetical protein JCM11641_001515 [Rhodosporidiobolus odoratus]